MSFDWKLYIQLADELITYHRTPSLQEAYLRSAISRLYYGVFSVARSFLISKGVKIPRVDTHKFIREEYQKSPNRIYKKIAKGLRRLWLDRKDADYEDKAGIDIGRARTAHRLANQIMGNLTRIGAV